VVEIYCERVRDLLARGGATSAGDLAVKQEPGGGGGMYVEGATELSVGGEEEMVAAMTAGLAARAVSATAMNAGSSRSHCVVTVRVASTALDGSSRAGKLCMVDLAGSERQDKTGASGVLLAEGAQINKSLSCGAAPARPLARSRSPPLPCRRCCLRRPPPHPRRVPPKLTCHLRL